MPICIPVDRMRRPADIIPSKGPFTNDVSREGEGGGYLNSDAVKEVA